MYNVFTAENNMIITHYSSMISTYMILIRTDKLFTQITYSREHGMVIAMELLCPLV